MQVDLEPQGSFKVPLRWFVERYEVDVYLIPKEDEENGLNSEFEEYILILENITNYFSKTMEHTESPDFKQGIKSDIYELNEDFYVSVDIMGMKCGPEETSDQNAIFYKVMLNPPLVIENKSMLSLKVFEINNPGQADEEQKLASEIPPSMSDTLLQLDITSKNKSQFKFQFADLEK